MLDKKLFLILLPILAAVLLGGLLSYSRADNPWDNSSLDVTDPEGTLEVSATVLNVDGASEVAKLYATYHDSKGLYRPDLTLQRVRIWRVITRSLCSRLVVTLSVPAI